MKKFPFTSASAFTVESGRHFPHALSLHALADASFINLLVRTTVTGAPNQL